MFKRFFDFSATAFGLLVLALPLLLLALLVRIKLGSPVFFKQVRPGLHGKPFEMVKFCAKCATVRGIRAAFV